MERLKHVIQVNILLGAWLIAAPFVLGYAGARAEMSNDVVIGVGLIACSWWMLAVAAGRAAAAVLQLLAGLWLIATPFVLHYGQASRPFGNDLVVGILSVLVSAVTIWMVASRVRNAA